MFSMLHGSAIVPITIRLRLHLPIARNIPNGGQVLAGVINGERCVSDGRQGRGVKYV